MKLNRKTDKRRHRRKIQMANKHENTLKLISKHGNVYKIQETPFYNYLIGKRMTMPRVAEDGGSVVIHEHYTERENNLLLPLWKKTGII